MAGLSTPGAEQMRPPPTTLQQPDSPDLWSAARCLVEEYATSLNLDLGFQDFQHEIQSLPKEYGPPDGCFILAVQQGRCIGCGAFRRFSHSACEMKRLYVAPAHRNDGVGRIVADALIQQARQAGYKAMLLDTLPSMIGAQALYTSLGFKPTPAYRYNPVPGASFWKLEF